MSQTPNYVTRNRYPQTIRLKLLATGTEGTHQSSCASLCRAICTTHVRSLAPLRSSKKTTPRNVTSSFPRPPYMRRVCHHRVNQTLKYRLCPLHTRLRSGRAIVIQYSFQLLFRFLRLFLLS